MDIIGKSFESTFYGSFKVIGKTDEKQGTNILYLIMFKKTKYKSKVTKERILSGSIKDIYFPIKYGVACLGDASSYSTLYNRWHSMIRRCYDTTHKFYHKYGGNEVKVCDRWLCFEYYEQDVINIKGYQKEINGLQLDKDIIGNGKIYSFDTCIWVSHKENQQERDNRLNPMIQAIRIKDGYEEISNNQHYLANKYNLNLGCIQHVLKGNRKTHKGWMFEYV